MASGGKAMSIIRFLLSIFKRKSAREKCGDQTLECGNSQFQSQLDTFRRDVSAMSEQLKQNSEQVESLKNNLQSLENKVQSLENKVQSLVFNKVKERSAMGEDFQRMLRAFEGLQEDVLNAVKVAKKREAFRSWCNMALECTLLKRTVTPYQDEEDKELEQDFLEKLQNFTTEFNISEYYSQYEGIDLERCLINPVEGDQYNHEIHKAVGKDVTDMACDDRRYLIKLTMVLGLRVTTDVTKSVKAIVNIMDNK